MESTSQLRDLVENAQTLLAQGGTLESSSGSGRIADNDLTKAVAKTLSAAAPSAGSPSRADEMELTVRNAVGRAHSALGKVRNGRSIEPVRG